MGQGSASLLASVSLAKGANLAESTSHVVGGALGYWTLAPFALMLLCIAVLPLVAEHWFHHNRNKAIVSAVLGIPTLAYLFIAFGQDGMSLAWKSFEEYVSFIVLLFALYTISGGIHLTGNAVATPRHNLTYLAIGAVLANLIGTMGASMLLIRPLLRANSERKYSRHTVIFFIFAVSNVGGLLTPLGDPPLFLGFLRGVPFTWTLHLWMEWLVALGLILLVYMVIETFYYRKEPEACRLMDEADFVPMRIKGWVNGIPLLLVIVAVLFSDKLLDLGEPIHFPFIREVILVALSLFSLHLCPRGPRACNNFCWPPIVEVAVLFAGIFATMIPALALLESRGASFGLDQSWQYFWATGGLSSFLDNAPTYLTLASVAQSGAGAETVGALATAAPGLLAAISCAAVFMGANTYIGNAPNFAVKCIADRSGLKMPSFLGYMGWSGAILIPIWIVVTLIFFRPGSAIAQTGWVSVGMHLWIIIGSVVAAVLCLVAYFFFLRNLRDLLKEIDPENRAMDPDRVWLAFIPLFGIVWLFVIVAKVRDSARAEFESRNWIPWSDFGYRTGIAFAVLTVVGWVTAGMLTLVSFIRYWEQTSEIKNRLVQNRLSK